MSPNYDQMNKHRRLKPGEKIQSDSGAFVAEENVHDVADGAPRTVDQRGAMIDEAFERAYKKRQPEDTAKVVFHAGFEAGEAHGHALGFAKGATATIGQLTHSKGKGRTRTLQSGNWLGEPETKLEAINAEQLTAEVCALLAAYAIVATDHKVGAVIDALNTLPGVDIRFTSRDP